jgi:hypothetical protein
MNGWRRCGPSGSNGTSMHIAGPWRRSRRGEGCRQACRPMTQPTPLRPYRDGRLSRSGSGTRLVAYSLSAVAFQPGCRELLGISPDESPVGAE